MTLADEMLLREHGYRVRRTRFGYEILVGNSLAWRPIDEGELQRLVDRLRPIAI